jgi:hypothetical protein
MVAGRANSSLGHYLVPIIVAIRLALHLGKTVVGASTHDPLNAQAVRTEVTLLSSFTLCLKLLGLLVDLLVKRTEGQGFLIRGDGFLGISYFCVKPRQEYLWRSSALGSAVSLQHTLSSRAARRRSVSLARPRVAVTAGLQG